jgi:hypothetical protein
MPAIVLFSAQTRWNKALDGGAAPLLSAALRGDEAAVVTILTAGGAGGEVDRALDVVFVWVVGSKNIYGGGEGDYKKRFYC